MAKLSSITSYKIISKTGMQLTVLNYGATITALKVPLHDQKLVDVVLGFNSPEDYMNSFKYGNAPYFGAVVGRFAGRIRNGCFILNGKHIQLNQNKGKHHIHGGHEGLSQKLWKLKTKIEGDEPSLSFVIDSPSEQEYYPGQLLVEVTYTLTTQNELKVEYKANATEDTLLNLTQHTYFNLDGHDADVTHQKLKINSEQVLETDEDTIPTGEIIELKGHRLDFSEYKAVPSQIDDAFILKGQKNLVAQLYSPHHNLEMQVRTNQPSMQVYVGGEVDSRLSCKENKDYHAKSGICFETQAFPDAPNHSHFPSALLRKGETYHQQTLFKFNYKLK